MQTLVLHVGMGKAGSTAIQDALRRAAARLRQDGVFCCDHWLLAPTMGPHGFAVADEFIGLLNDDAAAFAARLARIFAAANPAFAGCRTIVWSNETLADKWDAVGRFAAGVTTAARRATIVICLRHQRDWLLAAYLQWGVKDKMAPGRVMSFEQFVRENAGRLDYAALIGHWQRGADPAAVIPLPYDPAADVVAAFAAAAGLGSLLAGPASRVNATAGYTAHALMKILNDQYPAPHLAEDLAELLAEAGLLGREFHAVDPCLIDLPDAELERIADEFDARNAPLRPAFGIAIPRAPLTGLHGRRAMTHPLNTDLIAVLLELILHQRREMQALRQQLEQQHPRAAPQ